MLEKDQIIWVAYATYDNRKAEATVYKVVVVCPEHNIVQSLSQESGERLDHMYQAKRFFLTEKEAYQFCATELENHLKNITTKLTNLYKKIMSLV